MIAQCTSEAKAVVAITPNGGYDAVEISLLHLAVDGVDAFWSRAPFQVLEIVHVCPGQKLVVSRTSQQGRKCDVAPSYFFHLSFRSSEISESSDLESTIRLQALPGHLIRAASPSSLILETT